MVTKCTGAESGDERERESKGREEEEEREGKKKKSGRRKLAATRELDRAACWPRGRK